MKRPLLTAVLAIAVAGGIALFAAGRAWGEVDVRGAVGARQHVTVSGRDVSAAVPALALAILALAVAVLAGRGAVRRLAGALTAVIGAGLVAASITARGSVGSVLTHRVFALGHTHVGGSRPAWWLVCAIAGVVAAVAGAGVAAGGHRWTGLGARYDAPTTPVKQHAVDDAATWDALDHGRDPTVGA